MSELLFISTLAGLTTVIGVLITLFIGTPGRKLMAFYFGLSTGIMALVVAVELLPATLWKGEVYGAFLGMVMGFMLLKLLHHLMGMRSAGSDSTQARPRHNDVQEWRRAGWMMAAALAFHHVPEGIAIGAGFQAHHHAGVMIALSMSLHNIPEGMGLAAPFLLGCMRERWILLFAFFISLCIPAGAWIGGFYFTSSPQAVTFGMAFAAGAMVYLIWKELGPAGLRMHTLSAQFGMLVSLVGMLLLHIFMI